MSQHLNNDDNSDAYSAVDCAIEQAVRGAYQRSPLAGKWSPSSTVVAAFVIVRKSQPPSVEVVSLGVGTRSVGTAAVDDGSEFPFDTKTKKTLCLFDCHAEVMARRGLLAYFIRLMQALLVESGESADSSPAATPLELVTVAEPANRQERCTFFRWKVEEYDLHLVVSQAPCGSMAVTPSLPSQSTGAHVLLSSPSHRRCFHQCVATMHALTNGKDREEVSARAKQHCGHVIAKVMDPVVHTARNVPRTKPGAGTPTLSLSCSDKIKSWWQRGVQGAVLRNILPEPLRPSRLHIGAPALHVLNRDTWMREARESQLAFLAHGATAADREERPSTMMTVRWFDNSTMFGATPLSSSDAIQNMTAASAACWRSVSPLSSASRKRPREDNAAGPDCGTNKLQDICMQPRSRAEGDGDWEMVQWNSKEGLPFSVTKSNFNVALSKMAVSFPPLVEELKSSLRHTSTSSTRTLFVRWNELKHLGGKAGVSPISRWCIGVDVAEILMKLRALSLVHADDDDTDRLPSTTTPTNISVHSHSDTIHEDHCVTTTTTTTSSCVEFHPYWLLKAEERLNDESDVKGDV